MTITIADGRGALWQWDTGRRVKITDGDGVDQIHYQHSCFGRSVDVDVEDDGTAIIPDELLQDGSYPRCEVTDDLLHCIDILVDGRFLREEKDISLQFRGSRNQRIIDLPRTLSSDRIVLWDQLRR